MNTLRSWLVVGGIVLRYALSRVGLAQTPTFKGHYPEGMLVFGQALGWKRNLRVVCDGFSPLDHPAVFAANHTRLDDPLIMFTAVNHATRGLEVRTMMRDNFLRGSMWDSRLIAANAFLECMGGISISRGNVLLSQLKPFLNLLEHGESFLIFSGRTRSRSGVFFEYRDEVQEPGGVSFFLAAHQRKNPELPVAAVPVARTRNVATNMNTISFGPPRYLAPNADRHTQRAFDAELVGAMADLVEINASHVVAGILYLKALHGDILPFDERDLEAALPRVLGTLQRRLIDPRAVSDGPKEVDAALRLFERKGFVERRGSLVAPRAARILSVPGQGEVYRAAHPLKYTVNQILHFQDFVETLEAEVLG